MASVGSWFTPAPQGNGSLTVNGQIVGVPMNTQFYPSMASAPFFKGSGQPPPTVPLNYMQGSGMQTDASAATAAANPWSFVQSPVGITLLALIVGILGLRYVHWRH